MTAIRVERCPHCGGTLRERTTEQNSALHAILSDVAGQKEWCGQKLPVAVWKRLLVAAFERANRRPAEMYPSVDGHGMDIVYTHTSRMSKQELSELIEWIQAWAIDQGIVLREPEAA